MVLATNIGNTSFTLSGKKDDRTHTVRHGSNLFNSQHDFMQIISETIDFWELTPESVTDVIISSVNPHLTRHLENAISELFSIMPKIVNASMDMKLDLSHYDTRLIGSDRIVVCEAAITKYPPPLIVFDFGTATTINVIDSNSCFIGGSILPGLMMGINALSKDTALLPSVFLSPHTPLIGQNTKECITSGAIFGNAAMLDGMTRKIEKLLGQKVTVIVTGGNAENIVPVCEHPINHEPDLLLEGLYCLYQRNFQIIGNK